MSAQGWGEQVDLLGCLFECAVGPVGKAGHEVDYPAPRLVVGHHADDDGSTCAVVVGGSDHVAEVGYLVAGRFGRVHANEVTALTQVTSAYTAHPATA